jgi:hypothetical protein
MYQAASRIFGSWTNAVRAAGVTGSRALPPDRWTPGKILSVIRALSRRPRRLRRSLRQEHRGDLVAAARRCFGTWAKAVIAAGVNPEQFYRTSAWTKERVLESILLRALNNEPLGHGTVRPRSLVEAGARIFGNWRAALAAAGVEPWKHAPRCQILADRNPRAASPNGSSDLPHLLAKSAETNEGMKPVADSSGSTSSDRDLVKAIRERVEQGRAMNATFVKRDDRALYNAASCRHGTWSQALSAAGLNPTDICKRGSRATGE